MGLIVICGPTGSGKTALALQLAKKLNGAIISADSRQIYREADIGTNKAPPKESKVEKGDGYWLQEGIKIYLYNLCSPAENFSVAQFTAAAAQAYKEIIREGKLPFLVGGTGFYLQAFLGEVGFANLAPDWEQRKRLKSQPIIELQKKLAQYDPVFVQRLNRSDRNNPQRLLRYLELARAYGRVEKGFSFFRPPWKKEKIIKIGLTAPRSFLYQRADQWTATIIKSGLLEETQLLWEKYGDKIPLLQGLIYRPAQEFLKGQISQLEMEEKIKYQLHSYIRRQLYWFQRDPEINWFNIAQTHWAEEFKNWTAILPLIL